MSQSNEKKRKLGQRVKPDQNSAKQDETTTTLGKELKSKEASKTKRYKFAPLNNLDSNKNNESNVLRSISVSQVRNTAFKNNNQNNQSYDTLKPPKTVLRKVPSYTSKSKITKSDNREKNSDDLSEQVIWKYSPNAKETSEKTYSSQEYERDSIPDLQNPPSTPALPNKLKSVLNFSYLHQIDGLIDSGNKDDHLDELSKIQSSKQKSPKDLLRDINDILNDIGKDNETQQTFGRLNELPSSPEQITMDITSKMDGTTIKTNKLELQNPIAQDIEQENILYAVPCASKDNRQDFNNRQRIDTVDSKHTTSPSRSQKVDENATREIEIYTHKNEATNTIIGKSSDSDEDDDLILDIYTQQGTKTKVIISEENNKPEIEVKVGSDDIMDDSLLDLLEGPTSKLNVISNNNDQPSTRIPESSTEDTDKIKKYSEMAKCSIERESLCRFVILSVREMTLPKIGIQKILTCIDANGNSNSIILRHPWAYLDLIEGDIIHIIEGKNTENKRLLSADVDPKTQLANDNLLVVHPDLLLSATTVGNSAKCLRNGVIDNLFQDTRGEPSIAMTIGNIVHELLQDAFKYKISNKMISVEYLTNKLDSLLNVYSFAILVCNETIADVRAEIFETHLNKIYDFVNKFVTEDNYGKYVSIANTRRSQPISISNVIDIEENVWSHMFGFKGFLDATVEAHVEGAHYIVPLEVKTGKAKSIAHETQGLIYTLLLSDKYEMSIDFFLLLYTRDDEMTKFQRLLHSVRHTLMTRNKLATSLKHRLAEIRSTKYIDFQLPTLSKGAFCNSCFNKTQCMVLNKLVEDGTAEDSGISIADFEALTGHLSKNITKYKDFFLKYNDLISKEESSICKMNQELFLLDSKTRESLNGHCISNLTVSNINEDQNKLDTYLYEFRRGNNNNIEFPSMLQSQISTNDMIIISDENGHFALTTGYVTEVNADSIIVSTKRKFLNNRLLNSQKDIVRVQSVVDANIEGSETLAIQNMVSYRIDKNDIQQNLSTARFNILNIFLPPTKAGEYILNEKTNEPRRLKSSEGGDQKMREFIIDEKAPSFIEKQNKPLIEYSLSQEQDFNKDQINAIDKCFRAKDYALILGMPGTGKTTVIAELIKILVSNNKKILLTSYTHSAVDNILLKLLDTEIKIIRLGSERKIHPNTRRYIPNYDSVKTYNGFLQIINETSLVATTCLGIKDLLFSLKETDFDYVILDEASQVSMPVALGPLRFGDKFIMVGDHNQLPPLVKNEVARTSGLEDSLFKILCEQHPESMAELTFQYRMCGDIVKLSNFLIYQDKLKCGTPEVYNQCLNIPDINAVSKYKIQQNNQDWLFDILNPSRKVVFVNYNKYSGIVENVEGDNIINEGECDLVCQTVDGLVKTGVSCNRIGIMTLYRAQLRLLKKKLNKPGYEDLEVLTADQFQGRDKDCIIISMVRSNDEAKSGSLLREIRRVNVAMTRAKSKLIMFGSKDTISSIDEIKVFIDMLQTNGWVYQLPTDALNTYEFPITECNQKSATTSKASARIKRAKNIGSNSRVLKDKPITKQTLES